MSFEQGAGFRICGAVVRRFVAQSRKIAFITVDVPGQRPKKIELRAFGEDLISEIEQLGAGQIVEVTGAVDNEKLTDKKRNEVKVDGYAKWVPVLTVKTMKVEGSSRRAEPTAKDGQVPPSGARQTSWDDSEPSSFNDKEHDRFDESEVPF